ncbi:hypothetical protein A2154_01330 [Candidatus Gottesmanbacteria bacterium RBG_16_43_7]|uniref:Uncharacterized protein n=1 Tax=Candidatus Gottesmanbacteria bacterium RBG_16_43_7 TaxID=1798373 RepID=A0A1F5Z8M7_9BACT|nr:MAG: hypothetical protein A2154_01330 [Candidatus Gottesmanbacteria bacterium RBG_16_43_7]
MPKKPDIEQPEYRQVDATVAYRQQVESYVWQNYPLIESSDSRPAQAFSASEIGYGSFYVGYNYRESLAEWILDHSLRRAADPADIVYCIHGAQDHATFNEAVRDLREALRVGHIRVEYQNHRELISQTNQKGLNVNTEISYDRIVLVGPEKDRNTFIPAPYQCGGELLKLKNRISDRNFRKRLVEINFKYGVPFGILVSLYSGQEVDDIFSIYSAEVRRKLRDIVGSRAKIPSVNEQTDFAQILLLKKRLQLEVGNTIIFNPSPDIYKASVTDILLPWLVGHSKFMQEVKKFTQSIDKATPYAVIRSLTEVAQRAAPPEFVEPVRTRYINEHFNDFASTEVITAYLQVTKAQELRPVYFDRSGKLI